MDEPYLKQDHLKPIVFGESGNIDISWDTNTVKRSRAKLWVSFFQEASLLWWENNWSDSYDPPSGSGQPANLYIGPDVRSMFEVFAEHFEGIDADVTIDTSASATGGKNGNARVYALRSATQLHLYVHNPDSWNAATDVQVTIDAPAAGAARWINPNTGASLGDITLTAGTQSLIVPDFDLDVALRFPADL